MTAELHRLPPPAPGMRFKITGWKPFRKSSLYGFADVCFNGELHVRKIAIRSNDHGFWAALPSSKWEARDGKVKYDPIVEFSTKGRGRAFSDALVASLQREYPADFA